MPSMKSSPRITGSVHSSISELETGNARRGTPSSRSAAGSPLTYRAPQGKFIRENTPLSESGSPRIVGKNVTFQDRRQVLNEPINYRGRRRRHTKIERRDDDSLPLPRRVKAQEDHILEDLENQLHDLSFKKDVQRRTPAAEGDILDHFFEGVEGMVCKQQKEENTIDIEGRSKSGYSVQEENSIVESVQRLQKIAKREDRQIQHQRDKDKSFHGHNVLQCGSPDELEERMVIQPVPFKERDFLDRLFECGAPDEGQIMKSIDSRDVDVRAPGDDGRLQKEQAERGQGRKQRSSNSTLDETSSSVVTDDSRLDRLELLRQKKRQLELRKTILENTEDPLWGSDYETNFNLEKGIEGDVSVRIEESRGNPQVETRVAHYALVQMKRDEERNRRNRSTLYAAVAMILLSVVLIIIAALVFFPQL